MKLSTTLLGKDRPCTLGDIVVTKPMRGKKIGKLLFGRLIEEAKEKKFNHIIWQLLDWNEPANCELRFKPTAVALIRSFPG